MLNYRCIILFFVIILNSIIAASQCSVTISASSNQIVCGDSINLLAIGYSGNQVMNNDFDLGNSGSGWATTTGADYSNPCGPGNGTPYLWMGDLSPAPRSLESIGFDLSCGAEVCFDFRMAIQAGVSPCEGPDEPQEGIDLMYSPDGGITWVPLFYFQPNTITNAYTTWQNYCFTLPPGAWTANTAIGWFQSSSTSAIYDHWGLDNITIQAFDCNYYYVWDHNGSGNPAQTVGPTTDSTYTVLYTNGINDSCWATIPITVLFPTVDIDPVTPIICLGTAVLNSVLSNVPADSCCYTLQMDDSFGDSWNGGFLGIQINGNFIGNYWAIGVGTIIQICAANGDLLTLRYTSGNGPFAYESENSYILYDASMNIILNQGPPPPTGITYNAPINCGPAVVYNYQWTPGSLVLSPNSPTTLTTILTPGTYNFTVTVSNANNPNCFTTDTITVVVSGQATTIGIFHN